MLVRLRQAEHAGPVVMQVALYNGQTETLIDVDATGAGELGAAVAETAAWLEEITEHHG